MNIAATRRVSATLSSPKAEPKYYTSAGEGDSFVEHIDTSNNVFINDDMQNKDRDPKRQKKQKQSKEDENTTSSSTAYVQNTIEALAASGFYDETPDTKNAYQSNKDVGVYDNNQSFIENDGNEKMNQYQLKHFYENNKSMEEVDELV